MRVPCREGSRAGLHWTHRLHPSRHGFQHGKTSKVLTDDERAPILAELGGDAEERAAMLKELAEFPTGDDGVRAAVERLLADDTPCIVSIPLAVGEVRWLAAHALAAERSRAGIAEPVRLEKAVRPLEDWRLAQMAAAAYGDAALHLLPTERYAWLRRDGLLAASDREVAPPPAG